MSNFQLIGRAVHHTARPRFVLPLVEQPDGSWQSEVQPVWIDDPPRDARTAARLMREAGDYFAANFRRDWIQEAVIARAEALGLTSYEIAKRTFGAVSEDHVRDFITRRKSMGSHKLQHVLRVLGMSVTVSG